MELVRSTANFASYLLSSFQLLMMAIVSKDEGMIVPMAGETHSYFGLSAMQLAVDPGD